jgi:hypothetical protein
MPEFMHICPTDFLQWVSNGSAATERCKDAARDMSEQPRMSDFPPNLILAHLIEVDPIYEQFYKNALGLKIMDNGGFELYKQGKEMYDSSKLIEMASRVKADYIVLTDYPNEPAEKGISQAIALAPEIRDAGFGTFFVPQSEIGDLDDLVAAYLWAADNDLIDYIGFSILGIPNAYGVEKDNKLQRFLARWWFMQELDKTCFWDLVKENGKRLHMLGMVDGPNEITLVEPWLKYFSTWDSSAAIWAGLAGISFDNSPTGLVHGKYEAEVDFQHPNMHDDYANQLMDKNMRYIDALCAAIPLPQHVDPNDAGRRSLRRSNDSTVYDVWTKASNQVLCTGPYPFLTPDSVETSIDAENPLSKTVPAKFKYNEDVHLKEALDYIDATYGEHYVGADAKQTQVVDLWESLGSLDTTSRDTALKYLSRFGKKGGYQKKDLMKAIHYIMLLWHARQDDLV